MNVYEMQKEVLRLKEEQNACILAHSYVAREISEIADFVGDSYQLSVKASQVPNQKVIMCGVRFMAETVKILSPEKKVYLANPIAGCPMAEQMDKAMISQVKEMYPDYVVMAYVNTTAELKTIADVCVTSSSAVKIAKALKEDKILFIPDCNLGAFVAKQVPDKTVKLLQGGCPVHAAVKGSAVTEAKKAHPNALVYWFTLNAFLLSQNRRIMSARLLVLWTLRNSPVQKNFIIGTEISIAEHLQYDCPDKMFYPLQSI